LNVPNVTVYFTAGIVLTSIILFYLTRPKKENKKENKRDKDD